MPMMVMARATTAEMCVMASHQPASTNQTTMPMVPATPLPMPGALHLPVTRAIAGEPEGGAPA